MNASLSRLFDLALAVGVTVTGVAEVWAPFSSREGEGSAAASTAVAVVLGMTLALRRRYVLGAGLVVLLTWPVVFLVTPMYVLFFGQFVPMAVAVYSMARHGQGRVPAYGAAAGALTLLYFDLFVSVLQAPGEIVFHWGVFAIVWGFGFGLRRLELRASESTQRALRAEVEAAEQAMAAVLEERTRIARELHDIVAHSVSVMVVQAGAAEQVVGDDPELVRRALATIRTTGTDALGEMRRVVAMLRDGDEPGALTPQPGVDGVPLLVEGARQSGLKVDLEVQGEPVRLPGGVDLAAYRVVQEALTNVRRHAHASAVTVRLVYGDGGLEIEVSDDGVGLGGRPTTGGHGLVGMRERVSLYGGQVETSAPAGRGFVVHALLPVGGAR